MTWTTLLAAFFGSGGVTALLLVLNQNRKLRSESQSIDTKNLEVIANAAHVTITTSTEVIDSIKEQLAELRAELDQERGLRRSLEDRVRHLEDFIRAQGFDPTTIGFGPSIG